MGDMSMVRKQRTIKDQRNMEDMQAQIERQQATIVYVAAMADVELPEEMESEDQNMMEEEE